MSGQGRLREVIRDNRGKPANTILEAVLNTLRTFQDGAPREDDIALVIIKLLQQSPGF